MKETFPTHRTPMRNPTQAEEAKDELPEIALQQEMREGYKYTHDSALAWYLAVTVAPPREELTTEKTAEMLLAQKHEVPYLASAVLERTCNLSCPHCLYQDEKSSAGLSKAAHLDETIKNIVQQMPIRTAPGENGLGEYAPQFMSAGRILRPNHLPLFADLRAMRPDVGLGVIDNGTFTKLLSRWPEGFKFDWMDISIDGPEAVHNTQRDDEHAFRDAINGLQQARSVVRDSEEGGYVSSLFTLTNLNAGTVQETADLLLENRGGRPLVDKFNMTTLSPTNPVNAQMRGSVDDFARAWEGMRAVSDKYNSGIDYEDKPFRFNLYRTDDIEKLADAIGAEKVLRAFRKEGDVRLKRNMLTTSIDGVPVMYLPLSIWTPEEFLIEADGAYRTAYEGMFTMNELRTGVSADGRDTRPYTVEQLTPESDFRAAYEHGVDHYWTKFGKARMSEEMETWRRIREKAGE